MKNSKMIENIQPPIAKIIPTEERKFGDVRVDNYFG
jgi:oligopeptidase B